MSIHQSKLSTRFFGAALSFAALAFVLLAATGVRAQFSATDFLVADRGNGRIAVFDYNFNFLRYLDSNFPGVTGLDLLPNGNLVAVSQMSTVRVYNRAGVVLKEFSHPFLGQAMEIKSAGTNKVVVATQNPMIGVSEFDTDGNYVQSISGNVYTAVAPVAGNRVWAGGFNFPQQIDSFDMISGVLASSYEFDFGQFSATAMFYSTTPGTVLVGNSNNFPIAPSLGLGSPLVYERATDSTFVRAFYNAGAPTTVFGVTRGPNGDVYATDSDFNALHHWLSDGTYLGETTLNGIVDFPHNIVWAGNVVAPTAADVTVAGRVLNAYGRGVSGASVSLTDAQGAVRTKRTNSFGAYSFEDVATGQVYTLAAAAKGVRYDAQVVSLTDGITNLDFRPATEGALKIARK